MKTRISYLLLVFMCFTLVLPAQTKDRISIELKGETLPTAYSGGYPFSISGDIRSLPS